MSLRLHLSRTTLLPYCQETLRHILLGDYAALMDAINQIAEQDYCVGEACPEGDRIAWSAPIPTGRSGEYLSVMTPRQGVTAGAMFVSKFLFVSGR